MLHGSTDKVCFMCNSVYTVLLHYNDNDSVADLGGGPPCNLKEYRRVNVVI